MKCAPRRKHKVSGKYLLLRLKRGFVLRRDPFHVFRIPLCCDLAVSRRKSAPRGQWRKLPHGRRQPGNKILLPPRVDRSEATAHSGFPRNKLFIVTGKRRTALRRRIHTVYFGFCLLVHSMSLFFTHHRPSALNKRKLNVQELLCSFIVGYGENGSRK